MANLPAELWAKTTPSGAKDGTSLGDAAGIDPNAADDLLSIINAGTVVESVTINLCADSVVPIGASFAINKDAAGANRITMQGRTAADDADAEVTLDAEGGSFHGIDLTAADYWGFRDIHVTNAAKTTHNAWNISANADDCWFLRCRGSWSRVGFQGASSAGSLLFVRCRGHNNSAGGIEIGNSLSTVVECAGYNNMTDGIFSYGPIVRSVAYDNDRDGLKGNRLFGCVAYRNNGDGIQMYGSMLPSIVIDCIAAENGGYGCRPIASGTLYLLRFGTYNNTSGRNLAAGIILDEDDPGLSADPFVEGSPKYVLAAGASGATATDNGAESNIEDLDNGSWGGSVEIGDRIRFFEGGTDKEDAIESVVTAIDVGADADVITVSPQVTAGAQKQCWLGGGNFALNDEANGGTKCRNTDGRATVDGWSTDYLDIGAVQHLEAGGNGNGGRTIYSIG